MRVRLVSAVLAMSALIGQIGAGPLSAEHAKASALLEERGEVCFEFYVDNLTDLDRLGRVLSIDKVEGNKVFAYADKEGFDAFVESGLYYETKTPPGLLTTAESSDYADQRMPYDWTKYPTYSGYIAMLDTFAATYPALCKVYELGTTNNNKKLMVARVTSAAGPQRGKPKFFATATLHGDETLGFVLMLRMIEYLCMNYHNDATVKKILEGVELWINPLSNPDGSYGTGNAITQPRRFNANSKDLNRNFPGPSQKYGLYTSWEKETRVFLDFEAKHRFALGIDIHGGMENIVYPWAYARLRTPDEAWWVYVSKKYVDIARANSVSGYLTTTQSRGYGCAGIDYYTAPGTRMDGPYFHSHFRCVTLELHSTKFLPANRLENHWRYNYKAILDLFLEALNGVQGTVTDSITGAPLGNVKVWVDTHDRDSSFVRSDTNGFYARPIIAGTYSMTFSLPGYQSKTISGVRVVNGQPYPLDVKLWDGSMAAHNVAIAARNRLFVSPAGSGFVIHFAGGAEHAVVSIYDTKGALMRALPGSSGGGDRMIWDGKDYAGRPVSSGCYIVSLGTGRGNVTTRLTVNR